MKDGSETFRISADAYRRYMGRYASLLAPGVADRSGVKPGERAIDVGCGPGALASELADRIGPNAVAGADPSEPFVEACRAAVPGADIRVAPAEQLPFGDGEFDRALSQLVVNFMSDAVAGVAEMSRVVRPGGTVTAAVWDYGGEMKLLRSFWDAAAEVDPESAGRLDEGKTMPYCDPESLGELWSGAGLGDVSVETIVVRASYADLDDLWEPLPYGVGPSGAHFSSLDAEGQEALKRAWSRLLGDPAGPFELEARAWCARGTVPPDRYPGQPR